MNEERVIDIMKRIGAYIQGKLTQDEIDLLWIEFLKAPEWYEMFETELHLYHLRRSKDFQISPYLKCLYAGIMK